MSPVCLQGVKKKACFLPSSFMVSIEHPQMYLITLRLEKEINVLEKCLEKVLNFGSKNLYEPGLYLAKGTGITDFGSAMQCCVSFSVWLSA